MPGPRRRRPRALETLEARVNLSAFAEPVRLASTGGVLDITLRAHESSQVVELADPADPTAPGIPTLVDGFLTYAWTVHNGASSDGKTTGDGPIGPTLQVNPGDRLRIRLENALDDVSAVDKPAGDQPTNLHTHGLVISPAGNSDNVLLDLPEGSTNVYDYAIPADQEPGVNWYHPHRHEFVADQVYRGMMGFLVVGSGNNDIDQVKGLPTRLMVLQAHTYTTNPLTGRPKLAPLARSATGNMQLTINGQYMPELQMQAETEVWIGLQIDPRDLVRTFMPAPGTPPAQWDYDAPTNQPTFYIAQDGSAFPSTVEKARVALAPGKRVSEIISAPPAGQTRLFVGAAISPTTVQVPFYQSLMTVRGFGNGGNPADWVNRPLTSPTMQYEDLSKESVAARRTVVFETKTVDGVTQFMINDQVWPNTLAFQARAGQVEEWTVINKDAFPHPIHLHMQHFQAQAVNVGQPGYTIPPHYYDQDVWYMDANTTSVFRIKFRPTLGESVFHCHNLFHEDGGMMAHLNVIAEQPQVVAGPAQQGGVASFFPLQADDAGVAPTPTARVAPFGPRYRQGMGVAMGDVNFDGVPDAIFATGTGRNGRVVVRDGASNYARTLMDVNAFAGFRGRLNVAAGDVNGDGRADILVAGDGGSAPVVRAFSGRTGALLSEFLAYEGRFRGGVRLAAGDVDGSGRVRIVTAPGRGRAPEVRAWGWDLFEPNAGHGMDAGHDDGLLGAPMQVGSFLAAGDGRRGGVEVAAGLYDGAAGGFTRVVTAAAGEDRVRVWTLAGSGHAAMSEDGHAAASTGANLMTEFRPYDRSRRGDRLVLGTVNTTTGALITVGPRLGRRPSFRLFDAGPDGRARHVGTIRAGSGSGLALGGS